MADEGHGTETVKALELSILNMMNNEERYQCYYIKVTLINKREGMACLKNRRNYYSLKRLSTITPMLKKDH